MSRPIQATIHLDALRHNMARARRAAEDARVWAVVKANAYGHGIREVYEGLRGADGFALLDLDEAHLLRDLGWRGPLLLLEGAFEVRDLELCSRLDLWHVVHHEAQIDMLAQHKTLNPHRVFLKMNAGMNRLGLAPHAFGAAWSRLQALPQVGEISLMAHFSDADVDDGTYVQHQVFEQAAADLPGERSLSNSAALLRVGACRADWVRPGLMLYGASPDHPSHTATDWGLQPAMTLSTCIVAVQKLQAGDSVGYGSSFTAQGPMRIGVVACGYADGYMRQTSAQGAPVLVDGIKTRTLGRISMDLITLDLNPVPQARVGSTVTLWGNSPQGTVLPIEEVAQAGGTLAYELMCGVAPRVRKLASSGHGFAQTQHNNGTHYQ